MTSSPVGFTTVPFGDKKAGELVESEIEVELPGIMPGTYYIGAEFHEIDSAGANQWHDYIQNMLQIEILENREIVLGEFPDHTNKIPVEPQYVGKHSAAIKDYKQWGFRTGGINLVSKHYHPNL